MNAVVEIGSTKINGISTMLAGFKAQSQVNGLSGLVKKCLVANYIVFILIALTLNVLLYNYAIQPLTEWIFGAGDGWLATLGAVFKWIFQIFAAALLVVASLRIAVQFMSLWYENLAVKVIGHFREQQEAPFSFIEFLTKELPALLMITVKELGWTIVFLFLGLIPVIGIILVFLFESRSIGQDVTSVYYDLLGAEQNRGKDGKKPVEELMKEDRSRNIMLGAIPMLLAFVPVVGWFLMPMVMVELVIGFTFQMEARQQG